MGKKEKGFFIAGGLEFLVLAALLGGFVAVDQYREGREDVGQIQESVSEVTTAPAERRIADL